MKYLTFKRHSNKNTLFYSVSLSLFYILQEFRWCQVCISLKFDVYFFELRIQPLYMTTKNTMNLFISLIWRGAEKLSTRPISQNLYVIVSGKSVFIVWSTKLQNPCVVFFLFGSLTESIESADFHVLDYDPSWLFLCSCRRKSKEYQWECHANKWLRTRGRCAVSTFSLEIFR